MVSAERLRYPSLETEPSPSIFSFWDSYKHYHYWREHQDPQTAENKMYWKLKMDLLALRYEAAGEPMTEDILTRVSLNQDGLHYTNHQYPHDIDAMYLKSLEAWEGYAQWRHAREVHQTLNVWHRSSEVLKSLQPTDQIKNQELLLRAGFFKTQMPLSIGLASTFPELMEVDPDKEQKNIDVWLGPPLLTVSPPSSIHREGESSFGWVSRMIYLPTIDCFAVLQNGCFTAYSKDEILAFLEFENQNYQKPATEAEILAYINVLPPEYTAVHSLAIIDAIIKKLGYFKALPPIDEAIQPGKFNHDAHIQAILKIFEWEYQQCQLYPELQKTLTDRFQEWENAILHSVTTGFPLNPEEFFAHYTELYGNQKVALEPKKFAKKALSKIAKAYPKITRSLDLRKMDCMFGRRFKRNSNNQTDSNKTEMHFFGQRQAESLQAWRQRGIHSYTDLENFCREFNLPRDLFTLNTENKICPSCPKKDNIPTFIGPCCCPLCHAEDELAAISNYVPSFNSENNLSTVSSPFLETDLDEDNHRLRPFINLTQFLANDVHLN